jgi:micrococcal nuclease
VKKIVLPHTNLIVYLLSILLGLSVIGNAFFITERNNNSKVISVHDGDTFTLKDGQRVRLLGADAPELGRCGSIEAQQYLQTLILGKNVIITEEKRDTYGRRMGLVYDENVLVNAEMIKNGLARPDYAPNSKSEDLKAAFRYAKDHSLGIHSPLCKKTAGTVDDPNCVIKGNIDKASYTKLYHNPTCRHYNQIVIDEDIGERIFCTEKEAIEAGFTLAPDCLR